jgi:anti-anti-sigma regulatory factor
MLRITCTDSDDRDCVLLRLAGDVRGQWVDELRRACDEAVPASHRARRQLVLDLRDVLFIDARGVVLFHELTAQFAQFINCSPFVAEQLKEVADGCR